MLERLFAKRHISHLDLRSVRRKIVEELGWSSEKVEQVELEYRRFLYALVRKRPEDLISPPTPEVDEFWHRHILDTRKYREDCETVFGHYIDHTPGLSPEEQTNADVRRRKVYDEYDIDSTSFDSGDGSSSDDNTFGTDGTSESHHAHGSHAADGCNHSSEHGCDASGHDGGGHGGGDSGGGDGGGGDGGGGCGGGGCGGG